MKNQHKTIGNTTIIYVQHKDITLQAVIDTADLDRVSAITGKWYANQSSTGKYYIVSYLKGKATLLHRLIMGDPNGLVVDHIDGDTLNNSRRTNLRLVTHGENLQNRHSANSNSMSNIRGVGWNQRDGKWQVRVNIRGVQKFLGYFDTIEEAEKVAVASRKKHYAYSSENLNPMYV